MILPRPLRPVSDGTPRGVLVAHLEARIPNDAGVATLHRLSRSRTKTIPSLCLPSCVMGLTSLWCLADI